jgi:uncharacterized protein (TIGR02001 family)
VTATAVSPRPKRALADKRRFYFTTWVLVFSASLASPAHAQVAASLSVDSDYRLRGYSLSDEHPAASAQVSYDHHSGAYVNIAAIQELGHDFRFLGVQGNVGYARRLGSDVTLDVGLLRSQIRATSPYEDPFKYTEVYAGLAAGRVLGRVYYSPDYRHHGVHTLYGELEAGFEPWTHWRLSGHVGSLLYLTAAPYRSKGSTHQDWKISVSRQLGKFEIHSALSGGGPGEVYYGYRTHEKAKFTVGGTFSL